MLQTVAEAQGWKEGSGRDQPRQRGIIAVPRCCRYAGGVETNAALQCALRRLDYRVAQTEGLFRHLNPVWTQRWQCDEGRGYWIIEKQLCRAWF